MKTYFGLFLVMASLHLIGCERSGDAKDLHFSVSAKYPPFEYIANGEMTGFDIDLAKLVASELGKKAVFDNLQFSTVLPAVTSMQDDAAISTITITPERAQNFDFTVPYYYEEMVAVYKTDAIIKDKSDLKGKRIAAQLGSVMHIWMKQQFSEEVLTAFNNNNQAIEALNAAQVDVVLMDGAQGALYCKTKPHLKYTALEKAKQGYGIALKKGSPLTAPMNHALRALMKRGDIEALKLKWLGGASWSK